MQENGAPMARQADDWIATRQSLLSRLRQWDDRESWEHFFNTYSKLIYKVAMKSGLTEAEAQEVVQETVIHVAKKIPDFKYDRSKGSFKGWLLKTTQWRIMDQFRKRGKTLSLDSFDTPEAPRELPGVDAGQQPDLKFESQWDQLWEQNLLDTAIQRVKGRADPREFQMFDLLVRREWPAGRVAQKLSVTRARVYYAKYKISGMIRHELRKLQ